MSASTSFPHPDGLPEEEPIRSRSAPANSSAVVEISIEKLAPDPFQPRTRFTEEAIRQLAESIHQHGVLQALLIRPMQGPDSRGRYWIVAGERRYRAAQLLGLKTLPCRVLPDENLAAAVIALAENVHREDLSEIDKATALLRIKTLTDRTWEEVAEVVKLSRDYVKRLAGLLKLEEAVQEKIRNGQISVRTAIALRPLDSRQQLEMADRVVEEGLTAEQVREEVARRRALRSGKKREKAAGSSGAATGREKGNSPTATVAGRLEQYLEQIREIDHWLESREWAPSRVSERQRKRLNELYEGVSLLQQQLAAIRRGLREAEVPDAEKLQRADLPF